MTDVQKFGEEFQRVLYLTLKSCGVTAPDIHG